MKPTIPETVVVSWLKVKNPDFKRHLESVIQSVSQTLTLANKLGTYYLLDCLTQGIDIPDLCCDAKFWMWCMYRVTTEKGVMTNKPPGKYKDRAEKAVPQRSNETDETYEARKTAYRAAHKRKRQDAFNDADAVAPVLDAAWEKLKTTLPDGFVFQPRDHLSDLYTTLMGQYETNLRVSIATMMEPLMKKAIRVQVDTVFHDHIVCQPASDRPKVLDMIRQMVLRAVQDGEEPQWMDLRRGLRSKYLADDNVWVWSRIDDIILWHKNHLPLYDPTGDRNKPWELNGWGLEYLQEHAAHMLPYRYALIQLLVGAGHKSYAIVPQLDPRCRFIDVNPSTIRCILKLAHRRGMPIVTWMDRSRPFMERALAASDEKQGWTDHIQPNLHLVFQDLFRMPKLNGTQEFTMCLTTNGVQGNWHQSRKGAVPVVNHRRRKRRGAPLPDAQIPIRPLSTLRPGIYEHGKDFFLDADVPAHVVYIDPGHVNVMVGVTQPAGRGDDVTEKPYRLGNREYRDRSGMVDAQKKRDKLLERDPGLQDAYQALSDASAKVQTGEAFLHHVRCLARHWTVLFRHAFQPQLRKIRMMGHGAKRRAIHTIASDLSNRFPRPLLAGDGGPPIVLVVGNGVNSPTSRGHDSAPGKALRTALSRYFIILMSSEHLTSQRSPCCGGAVRHGTFDVCAPDRTRWDGVVESRSGEKIRGLFHCCKCNKTFDRDVAAAHNIRKVFQYQSRNRTTQALFQPLK